MRELFGRWSNKVARAVAVPPTAAESVTGETTFYREDAACAVPSNSKEICGVRRHGDQVTTVTGQKIAWDAGDWQVFFNERAAIAQHMAGLSREAAEARAYECAIIQWMNQTPPDGTTPDMCPACLRPTDENSLPVLRPGGGHIWLHQGCLARYEATRREQAHQALAAAGIHAPRARKEAS